MTVAVIGARGFLGSHLVTALDAAHVPTVRFTVETPFLLPNGSPVAALASADTAFYLASSVNPGIAERDADAVERELRRLDDFLSAIEDRPMRVVLASSGGTVYDTSVSPPYAEDARVGPSNRFGRLKLKMEQMLLDRSSSAIDPVILRISNVYGPGQRAGTGQGVIAHWLAAAAQGDALRVFGDASTTRDFVYIDDVVEAMVRTSAARGNLPTVVNIGSGEPTSLEQLAALVSDVVEGIEIVTDPDRGFDVPHTYLDVGLAARVLGWEPRIDLHEGLRRTWAHVTAATSASHD